MGKWIYVICFLLLTLNSIAVAENSMVTKKEQKEWLRHLIPLPHEISFKEKITIDPKNVLITVRKNASETEKYAASELKALFKEKTGAVPSGKAFEIIIGVIDAHGKLEGPLLKSAERLEIEKINLKRSKEGIKLPDNFLSSFFFLLYSLLRRE